MMWGTHILPILGELCPDFDNLQMGCTDFLNSHISWLPTHTISHRECLPPHMPSIQQVQWCASQICCASHLLWVYIPVCSKPLNSAYKWFPRPQNALLQWWMSILPVTWSTWAHISSANVVLLLLWQISRNPSQYC